MAILGNPMTMGSVDVNKLLPTALAWYDASNDAYLDLSGSEIVRFLDRSVHGNHTYSQATSTARMIRVAAEQNGLAAASADGGDYYVLPSALYVLSQNTTIFVVGKCTNTAVVRYYLAATAPALNTRYFFRSEANAGDMGYSTSGASGNRVTVSSVTKSNYNIFTSRLGTTNQRLTSNGGTPATNTLGSKGSSVAATMGAYTNATGHLIGGIAEVIIFDYAMSGQEIMAINKYLSDKWAITLA